MLDSGLISRSDLHSNNKVKKRRKSAVLMGCCDVKAQNLWRSSAASAPDMLDDSGAALEVTVLVDRSGAELEAPMVVGAALEAAELEGSAVLEVTATGAADEEAADAASADFSALGFPSGPR